MPTISGLRRRGFPPAAIRDFVSRIGITKSDNVVETALLEHCARELLNKSAERRMAVLRPLKVVIENYPEGEAEELSAINNPEDPEAGSRTLPFSRELYIERDDFMEDPPKKFFRLAPSREVRLRYAYFLTCREAIKNEAGEVVELRCTYDPETKGGNAPDGRKVKATIHWVSAEHALEAEIRLYNHLFRDVEPDVGEELAAALNEGSLEVLQDCRLEPSLADASSGAPIQFERQGYFALDPDTKEGSLIFNRTVALRDGWAKAQAKTGAKQ
jgi:glutaminyl-tRNA synthetase